MDDAQIIAAWIHGRSPRTQDAYRRIARDFLAHAGTPIAEATLAQLQAYADSLVELKSSSRRTVLNTLRSLFRFAHEQGHVVKNTAASLIVPKADWRLSERIMTEEDVAEIIHGERDLRSRLVLRLLYKSAFRASEFCQITVRDVRPTPDGKAGQVTVLGKGAKSRTVVIDGKVWTELSQLVAGMAPEERPFPYTRFQLYRLVRGSAERAGVRLPEGRGKNVSPHWFRHAHVSHSLDRNCPPHVVRETAGHSSLATTTLYAHAKQGESSGKYLGA